MKTKSQLIEDHLAKPFELNDRLCLKVTYQKTNRNKTKIGRKIVFEETTYDETYTTNSVYYRGETPDGIIVNIDTDSIPYTIIDKFKINNKIATIPQQYLSQSIIDVGSNPFKTFLHHSKIQFHSIHIQSFFYRLGFNDRTRQYKTETWHNVVIPEINWSPFIITNGIEHGYQRDFCWSLKEKQLLIDSIYNNIEIGKFVLRNRPTDWIENRIKQNKTVAFKDIVDGKQRSMVLIDFYNNVFPDSYGNYFNDLSPTAQSRFLNFDQLAYGELGEDATDTDVLHTFLTINHTGVPMSEEHINYVKSLIK